MELPNYLSVIKKQWVIILLTLLIVFGGSLIFTSTQKANFEGSTSLWITPVSSIGKKDVPYYEYDSYYTIQAGQLYASTIANWIKNPDVVSEIYTRAGLDLNITKLKDVDKIIKVTVGTGTTSNMVVNLKITHSNHDELQNLISSAIQLSQEKTQNFNSQSQQKITFNLSGSDPIIIRNQSNYLINGLIGLVAGLILGIFFAYLKEYFFKKED